MCLVACGSPAEEYHKECVRLVTRLHQWDVLRANKAPFAFGLETRVPFLDKQFLQVSMNIDAADKMPNLAVKPDGIHPKLEKYILRKVGGWVGGLIAEGCWVAEGAPAGSR